jgi:hypothetical protein
VTFATHYAPVLLVELGVPLDDPEYAEKLDAAEKALALTLAIVESYLDRKLEYLAGEVETFGPPPRKRFLLRRYPLEAIGEITVDIIVIPAECYYADAEAGVVHFYGNAAWPTRFTYSGGYKDDAWPLDLLQVMMELAAAAYPGMLAPGVPVLAGVDAPVRRVSVPNVGTIEYAGEGAGAIDVQGFGAISSTYTSVLSRYRAASIVGGA